jgi:hypothetical protein
MVSDRPRLKRVTTIKTIKMTETKEKKRCLHCKEEIAADKRADSKFCGGTCKARHWREQKERRERNEAAKRIILACLAFAFPERKKKDSFLKRLIKKLFPPQCTLFF